MFAVSQADEGADTMLHPSYLISIINLVITRGQPGIFTPIMKGSSQFLPYWQIAQNLIPVSFCVTLQVIQDIYLSACLLSS